MYEQRIQNGMDNAGLFMLSLKIEYVGRAVILE